MIHKNKHPHLLVNNRVTDSALQSRKDGCESHRTEGSFGSEDCEGSEYYVFVVPVPEIESLSGGVRRVHLEAFSSEVTQELCILLGCRIESVAVNHDWSVDKNLGVREVDVRQQISVPGEETLVDYHCGRARVSTPARALISQ